MQTLLHDLRYGLRVSLKSPGFTIVAVLTLAVGIAANTTVFSWIDAVLLRPLPGVTDGDRLAAFETVAPDGDSLINSYPDYRDYRDHLKLVDGLAVATPSAFSIGEEERPQRIWGELVSGNYFAVLGVKPALGRVFSADEYGDRQDGYPVAVIGHDFWQRAFNSSPGAIGQTIRVNRQQLTIVGVAPSEFHGVIPGLKFDVWVPVMMAPYLKAMPEWMLRDRQSRNLIGIARLKPGVSIEQARQELAPIAQDLARVHPDTNRAITTALLPVWQAHFGAQAMLLAPLRILMAVCGVVLLIVCANVANLLLARATARQKEFSLRLSLGAGRTRLVRQLLTETLVLALMGTLAGVPLAMWMSQALQYLAPPSAFPLLLDVRMNGTILTFTILVCLAACLLSGTAPAWHTARLDLNTVLKEGGRGSSFGSRSQRTRGWLVIGEVALALVAIIGAGLFARSFQIASRIRPGFEPDHVAVSYVSAAGYSADERKLFCRRLRERLESQPGLAGASYSDVIPLGFISSPWEDLKIDSYVPGPAENMKISRDVVAPGYFDVLKIPLVEGRDFTQHDDEQNAPVMVVNQTFARRFLAGREPIGHRVRGWAKWFTIVGVVADSKYRWPNEAPTPYFYVPFQQVYRADLSMAFSVRTTGDPEQALPMLRREARALDPNVTLYGGAPLAEHIGASLFPQRVAATLVGSLGAVALVLAAVGLYSIMAYSIAQRTHEIGIRMALGAQPSNVFALVLRQGMTLALTGLAIGVAAALAVTRLAAGMLVHVSASDPLVFGAAALFLAAVAVAAIYIPARRATRIDPNVALRCQ